VQDDHGPQRKLSRVRGGRTTCQENGGGAGGGGSMHDSMLGGL
jgi:hypothetical protein